MSFFEPETEIISVNGRNFRRNKESVLSFASKTSTLVLPDEEEFGEYNDEFLDCKVNPAELKAAASAGVKSATEVTAKLTVPKVFHKFLVGKSRLMQIKIQRETGTTLKFPDPKSGSDEIVIRGPSATSIDAAKNRILIEVENVRPLIPFTHFLSVPLTSDEIQSGLSTLYKGILTAQGHARGIDMSICVAPTQIHLTLLMLKLFSPADVERASKLMDKCVREFGWSEKVKESVVMPGQRKLQLKGLNYMNDDPMEVDVLYLQVSDSPIKRLLIQFVEFLQAKFRDAHLVSEKEIERNVNLHATVMNSKLRSKEALDSLDTTPATLGKDGRSERRPFDASGIIRLYGDIEVASVDLSSLSVHLSERGKFDEGGYYHCVNEVTFQTIL